MAGTERSRRSSRVRRRESSSDGGEEGAMLDTPEEAAPSGMMDASRESDRLAKIQEKNRKAQQKFRERRKEKMMSMEKTIQNLEQLVLQLRTEKEHVQEQLAVEKRINAGKGTTRDNIAASIASTGLQDYDPIDMSFLPMWQGLQLSNEKIRSMPVDTLKALIQTILQDLRTRLSGQSIDPAGSVSQSLGSCLIEPIRYRKVVVEILGPGAAAAVADESNTVPLSPDQVLRIHAETDRFDKAMATIWKLRLEALEALKKSCRRCSSEVENMQNFLLVYAQLERIQETLRSENEVLVAFLNEIGRTLGHMQLTQAMFASSGQDILSFCRAVHDRVVMQGRAGGSAGCLLGHSRSPFPSVGLDSRSVPNLPASSQWFRGSGLMGLQSSYPMQSVAGSGGAPDLGDAASPLLQCKSGGGSGLTASGAYPGRSAGATVASASMSQRPSSPGSRRQAFMHDSPFLYGPDGATASASAPFHASPLTAKDFRTTKVAKTAATPAPTSEPGVGAIAGPSDRQNSFLELLRSLNDSVRQPGANSGSGTIAGLPNAAAVAAALSPRNPAELLDTLNQMSAPTVKGLVSLIASQSAGSAPPLGGSLLVGAGLSGSGAPNTLGSDLEQLLNSKDGSRTLDILARDLSVSRTLSAGELVTIPGCLDIAGHTSIQPSPRLATSLAQASAGFALKPDPVSLSALPAQPSPPHEARVPVEGDSAVADVGAPEASAAAAGASQQMPGMSTLGTHASGGGAVTSGTRVEARRLVRSTQVTSGQLPQDAALSQGL